MLAEGYSSSTSHYIPSAGDAANNTTLIRRKWMWPGGQSTDGSNVHSSHEKKRRRNERKRNKCGYESWKHLYNHTMSKGYIYLSPYWDLIQQGCVPIIIWSETNNLHHNNKDCLLVVLFLNIAKAAHPAFNTQAALDQFSRIWESLTLLQILRECAKSKSSVYLEKRIVRWTTLKEMNVFNN